MDRSDDDVSTTERAKENAKKVACCAALLLAARKCGSSFRWELLDLLPANKRETLLARIPNTIQALIVGGGTVYYDLYKQIFKGDVFNPFPEHLTWLFSLSCAYSLIDTVSMVKRGEPVALYAHHLMQFYGTWLMLMYRRMAWFPSIFQITTLTDLTTTFVFLAAALKQQQPQQYTQLHQNSLKLRFAMFALLRLFLGPLSIAYAINQHGFNEFRDKFVSEKRLITVLSTINVVALSTLNATWTYQALARLRK